MFKDFKLFPWFRCSGGTRQCARLRPLLTEVWKYLVDFSFPLQITLKFCVSLRVYVCFVVCSLGWFFFLGYTLFWFCRHDCHKKKHTLMIHIGFFCNPKLIGTAPKVLFFFIYWWSSQERLAAWEQLQKQSCYKNMTMCLASYWASQQVRGRDHLAAKHKHNIRPDILHWYLCILMPP